MDTPVMSTFLLRKIPLLALAALVTACASIKTGSHYDETANFAAYRTFSWVGETPYVSADDAVRISPLTQSKIQDAIRDRLVQAGYTFSAAPASGDFLVAYTVGTREKIRVDSYPITYPGAWAWHIHGSPYVVREIREHHYTRGTLGVDIFDGRTNKPIWHGWAEKTITDSDRRDPDATIDEGVSRLFEAFPR